MLDSEFWWARINKVVRSYVATGKVCQKSISKKEKISPELHPILVPTKVWHQVSVDLCTLPKNVVGYAGISLVTDYFTKWVEAKSIYRKNAEEISRLLYELICRHGCTMTQINDQGREFCNKA